MRFSANWTLVALLSSVGCAATAPSWLGGCPSAAPPAQHGRESRPPGRTRNLVLITIDGVRWQEVFGGVDAQRARAARLPSCQVLSAAELLPNLQLFAEGGISVGAPGGSPMVASGPNFVSLPGYREILTGRAPRAATTTSAAHTAEPTLLDELARQQHVAREQSR